MPALAHRAAMPRPDDPQLLQAIEASAALGHPIQTAGRMAGLGHTTAWDWHRRGLALLEQHPDKDPRELGSHAVFADAFERGAAQLVQRKLEVVNAATEADPSKAWLPAMTLLERRRPQDFGRRDRLDVNQQSVTINVTLDAESLAASERVLAQLLARGLAPTPQLPPGGEDAQVIDTTTTDHTSPTPGT